MKGEILEKTIFRVSVGLMLSGLLVFVWIFYPIAYEELKYQFGATHEIGTVVVQDKIATQENQLPAQSENDVVYPVNADFGIVIPKISANASVIADVDADDAMQYQQALSRGVAQAAGTAYPDENGNMFLFAHSGADFFEAQRFNAVFYLLSKMEKGDVVYIFYKGKRLTYEVISQEKVNADQVEFMDAKADAQEKTLTLMTCWPAGTTLKRLIVIARQVDIDDSALILQ